MQLRYYQQEAIDCVKDEFNGLLVLPTGTGKSHIISGIAQKYPNDFILVFQPSKEILEQNYAKILNVTNNPEEIGIYSASLGQKNIKRITFATIGSIKSYDDFNHFKIIIVDEAHLVNADAGKYEKIIRYNFPKILVGLTATPYRMYTNAYGSSCWRFLHTTTPRLFNKIAYIYQNKQAFDDGFLVKPTYHEEYYNTSTLDIKGSEYSEKSILRLNKAIGLHDKIVESVHYAKRKHNLIFTTSIEEAEIITDKLRFNGISSSEISSKNSKKEREKILKDFKSGQLQAVINIGVLTTGFDFPALDCIIGARPTMSLGLYIQMIGRGIRPCEGKTSCDYFDICANVKVFGKIEDYVIGGEGKETYLKNANGYLITPRSINSDGGDWIIPFGKFRGLKIGQIGRSYIEYCLKNMGDNFFYKRQFETELMRRAEL